jgi:hypothetical protein
VDGITPLRPDLPFEPFIEAIATEANATKKSG